MTTPASPNSIAFSQINTELSLSSSAQLNLGNSKVRTLAGVASGQISASNARNKSWLDGSTSAKAAPSASYIKTLTGTTTDGIYWIKPGTNPNAIQVYCDMNTDGGGWMLIARSHGSVGPGSGWGWTGTDYGSVTNYNQAFQLSWQNNFGQYGATFTSFIFGNRGNINNNAWGHFIYKHSNINYATFSGSDTQQTYTYSTLKYNLSVWNSSSPPTMQSQIGFFSSGTSYNDYYMRDCCGLGNGGWGAKPLGMVTYGCDQSIAPDFSGPWCGNNNTDGSGNFVSATSWYMIMVK